MVRFLCWVLRADSKGPSLDIRTRSSIKRWVVHLSHLETLLTPGLDNSWFLSPGAFLFVLSIFAKYERKLVHGSY